MNHMLDEKDRIIISLMQKNPHLSQSEIAQHVDLSQPAAYFRIQKLVKKGFLSRFVGVDIKKISLLMAKLDIQVDNPDLMFPLIENCPYILNSYYMDGGNVFSLFMGGEDKGTIQAVKSNILKSDGFRELHFHSIRDSKSNLIMPLSMVKRRNEPPCMNACQKCDHYVDSTCLACPYTEHYRGTLW